MTERVEVWNRGRDLAEKLRGEQVPELDPTVESPCDIFDADTGEMIGAVRRCPEELTHQLRHAVKGYPMSTTLRASGMWNRSAVFGFTARNSVLRREGCRQCGSAAEAPERHDAIVGAAAVFAEMLAEANPERCTADQWKASESIRPEWRMGATQWTSGVLNETSALAYHTDANNLPTWNAMVVIRRGTRGGHFHVPQYGLTLPCRDGDVCFFPAYRIIHGVTPIRKVEADGYRYSAVYYTVRRMGECLDAASELAYGRETRTARQEPPPSGQETPATP